MNPQISAPSIVGARLVVPRVVVPDMDDGDYQGDPLGALTDGFGGTSLDPKWTLFEGSGDATTEVTAGVLRLSIAAGGLAGSFWYDANLGVLLFQLVDGDFDVTANIRIYDAARSGLPPTTQFRLAGLAAHDPDRGGGVLNYVHVALGSAAEATLRCEWKTTVNSESDSGVIATGQYGSIAWPTGTGQIRLTRIGQVFTAYVRATSSDAWTLVQEMDRAAAPMPDVLQVGLMIYSNLEAHDISADYDSVVFATP